MWLLCAQINDLPFRYEFPFAFRMSYAPTVRFVLDFFRICQNSKMYISGHPEQGIIIDILIGNAVTTKRE